MKSIFLLLFTAVFLLSNGQTLSIGDKFLAHDSSYYMLFEEQGFRFYNLDNSLIYNEFYQDANFNNQGIYYITYNNGLHVLLPKAKKRFVLNEEVYHLVKVNNIYVVLSSLTSDTLLKVGNFEFLDFNNQIVYSADSYNRFGDKLVNDIQEEYKVLMKDEEELERRKLTEYYLNNRIQELDKIKIVQYVDEFDFNWPNDANKTIERMNETFFVCKKEGLLGLINNLGKEIAPFIYKSIDYIYLEYREYAKEGPNYFECRSKNGIDYYTLNGKLILSSPFKISEQYFWPEMYVGKEYVDGFYFSKKGKFGILDKQGKVIVPPKYKYLEFLEFQNDKKEEVSMTNYYADFKNDLRFLVRNKSSEPWTVLNNDGVEITKVEFEEIYDYRPEGKIILYANEKQTLYDKNFNQLLERSYDDLNFVYLKDKFFYVGYNEDKFYFFEDSIEMINVPQVLNFKIGNYDHSFYCKSAYQYQFCKTEDFFLRKTIVNSNNEVYNEINSHYSSSLSGYWYKVKKDKKYGVLNKDLQQILPVNFDRINEKNGYFIVSNNKLFGLMNSYGTEILPIKYDSIGVFNGGLFLIKENVSYTLVDGHTGKKLENFDKFSIIKGKGFLYLTQKNGKFGLINQNLTELAETVYEKIEYNSKTKKIECYQNGLVVKSIETK